MEQFNESACTSNDRYDDSPNFGEPDGWGIMQIDHSSDKYCNSSTGVNSNPVPTEVVWNWKENIDEGVDVIREKSVAVERILGGVILDVTYACAIQLYNGAEGLPYQPALSSGSTVSHFARSCMVYDEYTSVWSFHANNKNYVRQVISR